MSVNDVILWAVMATFGTAAFAIVAAWVLGKVANAVDKFLGDLDDVHL